MVLMLFILLSLLFLNGGAVRKGKLPTPPPPSEYCFLRNVTCLPLSSQRRHCLSTHLTYEATSTVFLRGPKNVDDIFDELRKWSALQSFPECWKVIQPFLCSVYLPKCEIGVVERSSSELCQMTRKPCQIVADYAAWPEFLQCEAPHFQPGCYPLATRQKFNRSSVCQWPLMATDNPSSFYLSVSGCGIQCRNPVYSHSDHEQVHAFTAVMGILCLLFTLFAILTFLIDWKSASTYPSKIVFYINVCFFLATIGWILQFFGLRDSIVCRGDGTIRVEEPKMNEGESPWCTIVFFLVYFFTMAGVMWFVALTFSWYSNFQSLGKRSDKIESKSKYFHVMSWTASLVLAVVVISMAQIEGDSLSGICFIGYTNRGIRAGLVLAPVGIALCLGLYFLIKGLVTLIRIRHDCPGYVSDRATEKIQYTIIRIGVFAIFSILLIFTSLIVHIYIFMHEIEWKQSLTHYIACLAQQRVENSTKTCSVSSRQHLGAIQLHIFAYFLSGTLMASLVWTRTSFRSWNNLFRRVFNLEQRDPVKQHRMVARVFANRRQVRGPVSLASADDPVGIQIDLNSASSRPASSAMVRAKPRLSRRRSEVLHPSHRRYSDSDIQSVASYLSRRMSGDSVRMPESEHRNSFYSRHHGEDGLDVRQWARQAAKWTRRTRVKPIAAPVMAFHKQQIKLHKRHEAALERAARNSEISSISDGVSELSSAVFDRNLPLPPIGNHEPSCRKPDYTIFTASTFAPGELRRVEDPLNPSVPSVSRNLEFKRPKAVEVVDVVDLEEDNISVLEM